MLAHLVREDDMYLDRGMVLAALVLAHATAVEVVPVAGADHLATVRVLRHHPPASIHAAVVTTVHRLSFSSSWDLVNNANTPLEKSSTDRGG